MLNEFVKFVVVSTNWLLKLVLYDMRNLCFKSELIWSWSGYRIVEIQGTKKILFKNKKIGKLNSDIHA